MEELIYNSGKVIIFPLKSDEINLFLSSEIDFAKYINLNVFCSLDNIEENNSVWVIVKIAERAIVGYATLQNNLVDFFVDKKYGEVVESAKSLFCLYEQEYNLKLDYRYES